MASGDRVGVLALNSDRYLETMMAMWWAGGVLNPVNVRWSVPEIVYSLDDCDTAILIVDDRFLPLVESIRATARRAPTFIHAGDDASPEGMRSYEALIAATAPIEDAWRGGEDLACVMYTGGTTGFPKGVMQSHRNLLTGAIQRLAETNALLGASALRVAPLFHIAGLGRAVMQFIAGDARVLVATFRRHRRAAHDRAREDRRSAARAGDDPGAARAPDFDRFDLSHVQRLGYGASPSAGAMVEQLLARLPHVALTHAYGLTEIRSSATSNPPENHSAAARASGLSRSVGRATFAVTVRIVDTQGRDVPRARWARSSCAAPA